MREEFLNKIEKLIDHDEEDIRRLAQRDYTIVNHYLNIFREENVIPKDKIIKKIQSDMTKYHRDDFKIACKFYTNVIKEHFKDRTVKYKKINMSKKDILDNLEEMFLNLDKEFYNIFKNMRRENEEVFEFNENYPTVAIKFASLNDVLVSVERNYDNTDFIRAAHEIMHKITYIYSQEEHVTREIPSYFIEFIAMDFISNKYNDNSFYGNKNIRENEILDSAYFLDKYLDFFERVAMKPKKILSFKEDKLTCSEIYNYDIEKLLEGIQAYYLSRYAYNQYVKGSDEGLDLIKDISKNKMEYLDDPDIITNIIVSVNEEIRSKRKMKID